jgi:hypothetical protein
MGRTDQHCHITMLPIPLGLGHPARSKIHSLGDLPTIARPLHHHRPGMYDGETSSGRDRL